MTSEWKEIAIELGKVPALLPRIYGDLLRPGVKQVGKALETVFGLGNTILWPVMWLNQASQITLKRNLERFREKLEGVADEKVAPVAPEVGVPIAEKLAYVSDEKLSELYLNLLAKAANSDTAGQAHPSFVNVINNLSPDEALLLPRFRKNRPFLEAYAELDQLRRRKLEVLLFHAPMYSDLTFSDNMSAYVSNFEGLGLVSVEPGAKLADETSTYADIEAAWRLTLPNLPQFPAGCSLSFVKGLTRLTSFGHLFVKACVPPSTEV